VHQYPRHRGQQFGNGFEVRIKGTIQTQAPNFLYGRLRGLQVRLQQCHQIGGWLWLGPRGQDDDRANAFIGAQQGWSDACQSDIVASGTEGNDRTFHKDVVGFDGRCFAARSGCT
jgi:hypothetical protein